MNSVARSLALRGLHRREVRDRLQRPSLGKKNKQAVAAAGYSTAERLEAYRTNRNEADYLLWPALLAAYAGTWFIATHATRYVMTPPRTTMTRTPVEGRTPEVAASSPTN